ncbi:MAG: hypothetical protein JRG92_00075 [Deltaproteobacteria bacterium]|jgi:hypothetical protein|nr:hypothetical protein [Deltaproteobacteria bacterium]MBW2381988.1 hypothetical protein [Deltaproteobacteria bacterium]MBW2696575.1 hypothetical protein [Deltaproteobacteria bacterium]
MDEQSLHLPSTRLRCSYQRARVIDHDQQILECADLLSHPELLVDEMLDAYGVIESFGESELDLVCDMTQRPPADDTAELLLDHFYEGQEICVASGDDPDWEFRCLATDVRPVPELIPSGHSARDGFDYIASPNEGAARPILGVAQSLDDSSAYPLLLRLLACLTELAPASQLNFVNSDRLKGSLPPDACFDLHMVVWDDGQFEGQVATLCELSRDLAEAARNGMTDCPTLAARVGRIHCLRMNPSRFDGELEEMWRI